MLAQAIDHIHLRCGRTGRALRGMRPLDEPLPLPPPEPFPEKELLVEPVPRPPQGEIPEDEEGLDPEAEEELVKGTSL